MSDFVSVPRELVEFLHGSAPLEGVWFGEKHPTREGAYWWRSAYLAAAPAAQPVNQQLLDALRNLVAGLQTQKFSFELWQEVEAARDAIAAAEAQPARVTFFPSAMAWTPLGAAAAPGFTNIIQGCTCGRSGGTDCGKESCPYAAPAAEAQPALPTQEEVMRLADEMASEYAQSIVSPCNATDERAKKARAALQASIAALPKEKQ